MRGILFMAHSGVRYLVLLSAVIAVGYLLSALKKPYGTPSKRVMSLFTGMVDLQVLLGLLTLATVPFYGALAGHIAVMFAAAMVAHGAVIMNRNRPQERRSNAFLLGGVALTLLLIVVGILSIGRPIVGS